MNAIYRWLANHLPLTLVKLCAIRALRVYAEDPQTTYSRFEIKQVEAVLKSWAGNAAIDFVFIFMCLAAITEDASWI